MKSFLSLRQSFIVFASIITLAFSSCTTTGQHPEGNKGETPQVDLHTAILTDNIDAVKKHIATGTNLNEKEPFAGSTPLITATVFGKTQAAKLLIEAGSDLSVKNNDGSTALHVAAFFCRTEIVQALLEKGADKSLQNNFNATPLASVSAPWEEIAPIYKQVENSLKPMGLQLDLARIEKTRPAIAELLK